MEKQWDLLFLAHLVRIWMHVSVGLWKAFAGCYAECNPDVIRQFRRADTVFLLAFAIVMLNTDLHNKNIKPDRKMKLDDFVRNLRGMRLDMQTTETGIPQFFLSVIIHQLVPFKGHSCVHWTDRHLCQQLSELCGFLIFFQHFSSPSVDNVQAMTIVLRLIGKIIRPVVCCIVYDSCAQWYAHT